MDYLVTLKPEFRPRSLALVSRSTKIFVPAGLEIEQGIVHIQADLLRPWNFEFAATHVLHLAADGSASAYSEKAADEFQIMASHLANWTRRQERPKVFLASSGACFGTPTISAGVISKSEREGASKSIFVDSRFAAEEILRGAASDGSIDLRIGRLFSFIGKHMYYKSQYAVPAFIRMAMEEKSIQVNGNPETTRSYLSAPDMSEWIHSAFGVNVGESVLSIGSEVPVTMAELAGYIAAKTGAEVNFLHPLTQGDYYVADNEMTRQVLQVEERATWQTSIDRYLDEYGEMRAGERG